MKLRSVFELEWVTGPVHRWALRAMSPIVPEALELMCLRDAAHEWLFITRAESQPVHDPLYTPLHTETVVCPECFFSRRPGTEGMARTRSDQ